MGRDACYPRHMLSVHFPEFPARCPDFPHKCRYLISAGYDKDHHTCKCLILLYLKQLLSVKLLAISTSYVADGSNERGQYTFSIN